mmetsp:Transcript_96253/g.167161  ORF Transcript_96253/g.167161 Transcript_96253/m.167161 type:complete len:270 (-) Transcript_96253:173-982(-)
MGWRSLSQEKSPRWKPSLRRASSCRLTLWQLQGLFPKVTTATWKKRTRPMCQQMRSGARAASRMKQKRVTALTYTSLLATLAMPTRGNIRMRSGATAISCMNQKRVTVLTCTSLLAIVATPRHGAAPFIVNMGEHCFWRTEIDTCMPLGLVRLHQGLSYNMSRLALALFLFQRCHNLLWTFRVVQFCTKITKTRGHATRLILLHAQDCSNGLQARIAMHLRTFQLQHVCLIGQRREGSSRWDHPARFAQVWGTEAAFSPVWSKTAQVQP